MTGTNRGRVRAAGHDPRRGRRRPGPRGGRHHPGHGRRPTASRSATRSASSLVDDDRPESDRTARVAGIYEAPQGAPDLGPFVIGLDDFTAAAPSSSDAQIFVQARRRGDGRARSSPRSSRWSRRSSAADVLERRRVQGQHQEPAQRVLLLLIAVLLALSVVIAVLGHRQHDRPVGPRAHPRDRPPAGRGHASPPGAVDRAVGGRDHLAVRDGAGPGLRPRSAGWGLVRALRDEGFGVFEVPVVPFIARRPPRRARRRPRQRLAGLAGQPHERARRHRHRVTAEGGAAAIPAAAPPGGVPRAPARPNLACRTGRAA